MKIVSLYFKDESSFKVAEKPEYPAEFTPVTIELAEFISSKTPDPLLCFKVTMKSGKVLWTMMNDVSSFETVE